MLNREGRNFASAYLHQVFQLVQGLQALLLAIASGLPQFFQLTAVRLVNVRQGNDSQFVLQVTLEWGLLLRLGRGNR